jgi:hypothetical protein
MLFVRKTREKCVLTRQILSAQSPASVKYEHEHGLTPLVGENLPIQYFMHSICRMSDSFHTIILLL